MLQDTLMIWGVEFGRDHHASGFTVCMADGGARPGTVSSGTDEFGGVAIENVLSIHDLHATVPHLLGFDHERCTYRYAGRDVRLTDAHGHVVAGLVA
jgi:hypothetical protein